MPEYKLIQKKKKNHNTSRFLFELPDDGAALSPVTPLAVVRLEGTLK
jgi:hypothetical protein